MTRSVPGVVLAHRDQEDPMTLSFGVTVLPDPPFSRMIELLQLAEKRGFEYAWIYDSHVLWQESFPVLAIVADRTSTIKLGHMVTNPGTREPTVLASAYATLHDISNGRMIMGIGRGDSARRYIGQKPVKDAGEQVRWFPAMVSNHVQDLIDRYGTDGSAVPKALTDYVQARKFYDYNEHSRVGAKHGEFVTDEICDRFCVIGNVDQCRAKLKELESVGVDQFNIYLMTHGQEETLAAYGDDIIPDFSGVAA